MAQLYAPDEFIRLSANIFDNPKLADISDEHGPVTYVVWMYLLTLAKRAKRLGRFIAPPVRVARMIGADSRTVMTIMHELEKRRSIIAVDEKDYHYEIRNWNNWQTMSDRERQRKHRNEKRNIANEKALPGNTEDPQVTVLNLTSLNLTNTSNENPTTEDSKTLNLLPEKKPTSTDDQPTKQQIKDKQRSADIREVFNHWVEKTWNPEDPKPRYTEKRKSHINARLEQGFVVADLKKACDGYCASDWHNGKETGRVYLSLELMYRAAERVEKGIHYARNNGAHRPVRLTGDALYDSAGIR